MCPVGPHDAAEADAAAAQAHALLKRGQPLRALELFTALADDGDSEAARLVGCAGASYACLASDRPYEAIAWAEATRALAAGGSEADLLEGAARVATGEAERALELLDEVDVGECEVVPDPATFLEERRCVAHTALAQDALALEAARRALGGSVDLPEVWHALATIAGRSALEGFDVCALLDADDDVATAASHVTASSAVGAEVLLDRLWDRWPGHRTVLASIALLGALLPLPRALEWSARLRAAGLAEQCAVLGRASREDLDATERVRAAAVAAQAFDDPRALPLLEAAVTGVDDADLDALGRELVGFEAEAPFESFIVAAASTTPRSLVLAALLADLGVVGVAASLVAHAAGLDRAESPAFDGAARSLLSREHRTALSEALIARGNGELAERLLALG